MLEIAKSNPDIETLKLIVYLAGVIIIILLGVVSFFLRGLITAVNSLTRAVTILETQQTEQYPVIIRRLNYHSEKIEQQGKQIAVLETKLERK